MTKKRPGEGVDEASRTLSKSLDSRRSSSTSKKSGQIAAALGITKAGSNEALRDSPDGTPSKYGGGLGPGPSHLRSGSQASSLRQTAAQGSSADAIAENPAQEEVRKDLMWGP
jgi:autophagy-related protein 11